MKWQIKFFNCAVACLALIAVAGFTACSDDETPDGPSRGDMFYRHVMINKFTGTWCGPCASAQAALDKVEAEEPDRFIIVAIHADDPFSCAAGDKMQEEFRVSAIPTWYYNFATSSSIITGAGIKKQITMAEEDYPAVCGVKATSTLEGKTAKITATVNFQEAGAYKICCVLTENNLYYAAGTIKNKIYNHVLRAYQTESMGDLIDPAVSATGERTFTFEQEIQADWAAENLEFVVYVFKETGGKYVVNNGVACPVGGSKDYKYAVAK